jgi:HAD superfamily hydrolase (TIGR01459 family)
MLRIFDPSRGGWEDRRKPACMMTSSVPRFLQGLSEIAGQYDAAMCDVWGVLHNGRKACQKAADALRRFRQMRGPVVLLSNAPRLKDGVEAQFDRVGLKRDFYDAIVTSGFVARADLLRRSETRALNLFYLGPPRDNPVFDGLDIRFASAEEAELVFCTGPYDDETDRPEDYRELLEGFNARALTFLCANPDIVVQRGDKLVYCAGAIARLYEAMGGKVIYYGKPYPPIFESALAEARAARAVSKPLVIGDGIETDLKGANGLGWDALFIAGGIHAAEIREHPDALANLLEKGGASAIGAMPELSW